MFTDNPFCLLNIPLSADKQEIYRHADELSLTLDPAVCDEAAATLSNPLRRINAEIDWFPEDDESIVKTVRSDVSAGRAVAQETLAELHPSGRLNAELYNLAFCVPGRGPVNTDRIGKAIIAVDGWLAECSIEDIVKGIERSRKAAGITPAEDSAVKDAWDEKKYRITAEIDKILEKLSDNDHTKVINLLAERGSDRFESIILDLIDRYELRMYSAIEKQTEKLIRSADIAERNALTSLDFPLYYRSFNKIFSKWREYILPLQKAAAARGAVHQLSVETWMKIRRIYQVAIRKNCLTEGYKLALSLREGFECVPSLEEFLDKDVETAGEGIRIIAKKEPEEYFRIQKKNQRSTIAAVILLLLAGMFTGIMYICAPTEAELAQDPDSSVYREMSLPEKRDSHGSYETVRLPATGFVFQDTLGDESVRTCRVTVKNNTGYHYFIRFSDRDYGDSSITGTKNDDELMMEYLNEVLNADEEEQSKEGNSGEEEVIPGEEYLEEMFGEPPGLEKYSENCDDKVLSFVVRAVEDTEITLPPGDWLISYDHGSNWYGWKFRFNHQFDSFGSVPAHDWPVMTYDTDEPYSFEADTAYTVEIGDRTVEGSILLDEH